jgi:type II secretory pathway predicted ATPase ExeA
MYTEHYHLRERAFGNTPDPRFLYLSEAHEEALAQLVYAVKERELALLVGGIGTGKSLLIRALLDRLDQRHEVVVIVNPRLSPGQLLAQIAEELGVDRPARTKAALFNQLLDRLTALDQAGRQAVVVIDEAQLVPSADVFHELRLLTNFQLDDRNLLTLVLVGQPELRRRLERPALRPLAQRLGIAFELRPFGAEETHRYLEHRLRCAGANGRPQFTPEAAAVIHRRSEGIPRVINHLATQCLIECFVRERDAIEPDDVERVAAGMMFLPGMKGG